MPRLPFSSVLHHPTKDQMVLAFGEHFQVVCSKTGNILVSTCALEERDSSSSTITGTPIILDSAKIHGARIMVMTFSRDGRFLATAADDKLLKIWDTENNWNCDNTRTLVRRSNSLKFNADGSMILTGDKFGDVYNMQRDIPDAIIVPPPLACLPKKAEQIRLAAEAAAKAAAKKEGEEEEEDDEEDGKDLPILGHVSMVTDIALSTDNKYIISADRDEKIRVSQYPKGHNILTYCLGHTSFVASILVLAGGDQEYLLSGGGDGTLRIWDFVNGKQVHQFDINAALTEEDMDASEESTVTATTPSGALVFGLTKCASNNRIAVLLEKKNKVLVISWNASDKVLEFVHEVQLNGQLLSADFDLAGNLWATVIPTDKESTHMVSVFDAEFKDVTKVNGESLNKCGSITVETLPDFYTTEELRKNTTDWKDMKKLREERLAEKQAALDAGEDAEGGSSRRKRRKNKNSRKIPEPEPKA